MDIFYVSLITLGIVASGYLLGSISWARIITKYCYHVDTYKVGSGNAGGTNVGRAVGKEAAILVIVLDSFKCVVPLWAWFFILKFTTLGNYMASVSSPYVPLEFYYYICGLAAGIGHVFPAYSNFKGGKAVSCYAGFVLATNWLLTLVGCLVFFGVLKLRKRVSLSSILGVISVCLLAFILAIIDYFTPGSCELYFWFFPGPKMSGSFLYAGFIAIYTALVIILHNKNIVRLAQKKEPVTHFRHKGETPVDNYQSNEKLP